MRIIATAKGVRTFLIPKTVRLSAHAEAIVSTLFLPDARRPNYSCCRSCLLTHSYHNKVCREAISYHGGGYPHQGKKEVRLL